MVFKTFMWCERTIKIDNLWYSKLYNWVKHHVASVWCNYPHPYIVLLVMYFTHNGESLTYILKFIKVCSRCNTMFEIYEMTGDYVVRLLIGRLKTNSCNTDTNVDQLVCVNFQMLIQTNAIRFIHSLPLFSSFWINWYVVYFKISIRPITMYKGRENLNHWSII